MTLLVLGVSTTWLTGCSRAPESNDGKEKIRVLCSFFPMYLFTKAVAEGSENVEVELMIPAELGCPHDYDLQPNDMKKIQAADLLILNGAGLEEFAASQVQKANANIILVDSSANVDVIEIGDEHEADHGHDHSKEAAKHDHDDHDHDHEGHEHAKHDHDHDHDHDHAKHDHDHDGHDHAKDDHDHGHHHHGGINPHFFSSPTQAIQQVQNIADALAAADPAGAAIYARNSDEIAGRLRKLAEEFRSNVVDFSNRKIVTMHEVFDYLARDNGLEIVATIHSAPGEEPSPAEMRNVIEAIKESKAAAVFTEPQYSTEVAKTIAKDAGVPVFELDPVASGPSDAGFEYYEKKMRDNLQALQQALSAKE